MSANNYLLLSKYQGKYELREIDAGCGEDYSNPPLLSYDTLENAVLGAKCQMVKMEKEGYPYEYGLVIGDV
jgi:hypothetical protein